MQNIIKTGFVVRTQKSKKKFIWLDKDYIVYIKPKSRITLLIKANQSIVEKIMNNPMNRKFYKRMVFNNILILTGFRCKNIPLPYPSLKK